ncbi:MAG: 50S ribosomal protein L18 [Firmicutes bacterium]|nr:50S ribosomal protein L18 [Bacillota bacterium]
MIQLKNKNDSRVKRRKRIRDKVNGTSQAPRLSVFRSDEHIYAQLIDDTKGVTLCASSTMAKGLKLKGTKSQKAKLVGQEVAKKAIAKGIKACVFDRGGYVYMGRVKALAEGAREGGLQF